MKILNLPFRHALNRINSSYFYRSLSVIPGDNNTVGIRREDGLQWERRAPLAPRQVKQLVQQGIKVLIQPANRRAFTHKEYRQAGAIIQEDISSASLIVGVKAVPLDKLIPNRTYVFFSHTIKAQEASMPALDLMLERNIRLIDYEKMLNDQGNRVIAFGKWAGVAGMIDILHGLGLRLLALNHHTPFLHIGLAHSYRNSVFAKQAVRDAGYEIALGLMPDSFGPMTFVFTGSGNVSQGAQEVFTELPHEFVEPKDLKYWAYNGEKTKLYATVVSRKDYLIHKEHGGFDEADYEKNPNNYISVFAERFAPYASVIINGIFWAVNSPRLIKVDDLQKLLNPRWLPETQTAPGCPPLPHRLLAVADISADPYGSMEFVDECTSIDSPFVMYDEKCIRSEENISDSGVLVCSIDNMPAQIPQEATEYFGSLLRPYISKMLTSEAHKPFEDWKVDRVIKDAVICSNGKLTSNYEYIHKLRQHKSMEKISRGIQVAGDHVKRKVLMLGAGYVAPPCADMLTRNGDIALTIVSDVKGEAEMLAKRNRNSVSLCLDVPNSPTEIDELVKRHDLVISLLPWTMHRPVIESCIRNKCNMVTTSYLNPTLTDLQDQLVDAGISVMMETGLDPGIDHMMAKECIDEVHQQNGKIVSFESVCGGLPAPEFSNNPLRYLFSWSPVGVFLASKNSARFLDNNKVVDVPPNGGVLDHVSAIDIFPGLNLEKFPNRDSTRYIDLYRLNDCHSFLRGTIRYTGYCDIVKAFFKMGLLESEKMLPQLAKDAPALSWRDYICDTMELSRNSNEDSILSECKSRFQISDDVLNSFSKMGLFSEERVPPMLNPLHSISAYLASKYTFKQSERDFIVMRHSLGIEWPEGNKEVRDICMVQYGKPYGFSAMSKWVGIPCALASKLTLNGEVEKKGFILPLERAIYKPLLKQLRDEGLFETSEVRKIK